jgi:hypothetical protein
MSREQDNSGAMRDCFFKKFDISDVKSVNNVDGSQRCEKFKVVMHAAAKDSANNLLRTYTLSERSRSSLTEHTNDIPSDRSAWVSCQCPSYTARKDGQSQPQTVREFRDNLGCSTKYLVHERNDQCFVMKGLLGESETTADQLLISIETSRRAIRPYLRPLSKPVLTVSLDC